MTSNQNQRMTTRSQTKRLREEEDKIQSDSKRAKIETLTLDLPSATTITRNSDNSKEFDIIKRMKETQDELKALILSKEENYLRKREEYLKALYELILKRQQLQNELALREELFSMKRENYRRHLMLVNDFRMRIRYYRGEEVTIGRNGISFWLTNEE